MESIAVSRMLQDVVKACSQCHSSLHSHKYALLATVPVRNEQKQELVKFFDAVKNHKWTELRSYQEWLGSSDNAELYALRCREHEMSIAVIKTAFEVFQSATLLYIEPLNSQDAKLL